MGSHRVLVPAGHFHSVQWPCKMDASGGDEDFRHDVLSEEFKVGSALRTMIGEYFLYHVICHSSLVEGWRLRRFEANLAG